MYKVTKRDCPMFGIGPYVCEFICDTASDIITLPTSISEGTGGRTVYDNQKCASGSIANVAENSAESKQYILNNQNIWCPYSIATASSSDSVLEEAKAYTDSEIADLINGAPTTRDTLKEIADAMAENQTVVEALDAAIGTKANKTDIPTKVSQLENDSGYLTEHQDLSEYALKSKYGDTTINVGRKANTAIGAYSTAEGYSTTASSNYSHAEGRDTTASGNFAHAEGGNTTASGGFSHTEGWGTTASGEYSHAGGLYTKALHNNEVAFGCYNESNDNTLFSVGDGTTDDARHNAFEITTTGGKIHGKDIAVDVSNPNLLINPDFKINQRGNIDFKVDYHAGNPISESQKYTVDRWRIMEGRANISNGKFVLTGTIVQVLENSIGSNFTASVSVESGTATASYDDSTKTFTIVGNVAVLNWAKLEYGSVATPFISPDPATELLKCMRYYEVILAGTDRAYPASLAPDLNVEMDILFKVPKRFAPTLIIGKLRTVISTSTGYVISNTSYKLYQSEIYGMSINTVDAVFTELPSRLLGVTLDGNFAVDAEIY